MKKLVFMLLVSTLFWCNPDISTNTEDQLIPGDTIMTNSTRTGIITLSNSDTVRFDNGVTLRIEMDSSFGVHGFSYKCWSLVVDDTTDEISFGLKHSLHQKWCESGVMSESESDDTIWNNVRTFPDTLYPIYIFYPSLHANKIRYYEQSSYHFVDTSYYKVFCYNVISYFNTPKNKMMLQINDCNQSNVKISWAVDSLGNGVFNTSVQMFKRTGNTEFLANN